MAKHQHRLAKIAHLGGSANTPAQMAARQQNAQRAGRPGRICKHCGEPVLGGHKDPALDETCGAHGWTWRQRSEKPRPAPLSRDRKSLIAIHSAVGAARGSLADEIRALLARAGIR